MKKFEQRQNSFGKKEGYVIDAEIDVESDGIPTTRIYTCHILLMIPNKLVSILDNNNAQFWYQ
ncbi:hypothetical protein BpHYR1_038734 [Brachionus plicatilis]|uniref:Uncharacterized protein n=1 Tax=Brachionus plicatilis TaxID=10195 RepID=A0A3M7SAE6_BRAPC|nr:hypothetical protein BpHYR1_038734 [Brachionus plicatilis]